MANLLTLDMSVAFDIDVLTKNYCHNIHSTLPKLPPQPISFCLPYLNYSTKQNTTSKHYTTNMKFASVLLAVVDLISQHVVADRCTDCVMYNPSHDGPCLRFCALAKRNLTGRMACVNESSDDMRTCLAVCTPSKRAYDETDNRSLCTFLPPPLPEGPSCFLN